MPSKKSTKPKTKDAETKPNITFTIQPLPATLGSHVTIPKPEPKPKAKPQPANVDDDDPSKKRGRKSRGGKLISKTGEQEEQAQPIANVILHLKCTIADLTEYTTKMNRMVKNELTYNPEVPPEIHTYTPHDKMDFASYNEASNENQQQTDQHDIAYSESSLLFSPGSKKSAAVTTPYNVCRVCSSQMENDQAEDDPNVNMRDINQKLKSLKINLYKNTLQDKKSACFWCSYDFDNQPCYIPKYETDDKIYGYGSFCRPECAVAYLMKENLDDSTKFERYHLLNHIYSKVYGYKKNIKPAPSPYYLLEKYFGNLTIQEYRKLLSTEHLLTVIEKPMSRILPELFEDNDHFILGIYGNNAKPSTQKNVYKVKRQSEKNATQAPSKNSIMKERFGLA